MYFSMHMLTVREGGEQTGEDGDVFLSYHPSSASAYWKRLKRIKRSTQALLWIMDELNLCWIKMYQLGWIFFSN